MPEAVENKTIKYSSSNNNVVTIDSKGKITGVKKGTAKIKMITEETPEVSKEIDVTVKCIEEQTTQAELAEKAGTSPSYVNRLIKSPEKIINKTFIYIMEQLGYDVELTYVKK